MKKKNILLAGLTSLASIVSMISPVMAANEVTMTYTLAETDGAAVFHLDTTSINYTDTTLTQNINYHITTTAGNYFDDRTDVQSVAYTVTTPDTVTLKDSHLETNTMSVAMNYANSKGNLDLTTAVSDSTTYAGTVGTTATKPTKAGSYSGKVTVTFNCTLPSINS